MPPALAEWILRRTLRSEEEREMVLGDLHEELPRHGSAWYWRQTLSIIVHEEWHFRNGPDEAGAYEAQLQFLEVRGGGSAAEIAEGVRRARDRVKARTK